MRQRGCHKVKHWIWVFLRRTFSKWSHLEVHNHLTVFTNHDIYTFLPKNNMECRNAFLCRKIFNSFCCFKKCSLAATWHSNFKLQHKKNLGESTLYGNFDIATFYLCLMHSANCTPIIHVQRLELADNSQNTTDVA